MEHKIIDMEKANQGPVYTPQSGPALRDERPIMRSTQDAMARLAKYGNRKQEHMVALLINGEGRLIKETVIAIGTDEKIQIEPRDVFREAVRVGAYGMCIAHNHPQGEIMASEPDKATTKRLVKAAEALGIFLMDHVIVGPRGTYSSMRKENPEIFEPMVRMYLSRSYR